MHHLLAFLSVLAHAVHVNKDGDVIRVHVGPAASPLRLSFPMSDLAKQASSVVPAPARPFVPLLLRELGDAVQRHQEAEGVKKHAG